MRRSIQANIIKLVTVIIYLLVNTVLFADGDGESAMDRFKKHKDERRDPSFEEQAEAAQKLEYELQGVIMTCTPKTVPLVTW